jgi:hypothetical protein
VDGGTMHTTVTDEQIRQLAESAKPSSVALLWWGPDRYKDGADATEREHQRRMVSLRAAGTMRREVHLCHGFPGDAQPAVSAL